jgi:FAD/FMN-containing dehydrogenase
MSVGAARPWVNWSGTQTICAQHVAAPRSLAELRAVVAEVEGRSGRLKPVATGLSFSDILKSDDTLIETTGLLGVLGQDDVSGSAAPGAAPALLPVEQELFHAPSPEHLVRVPCGARIRALNAALARQRLAFTNLGGYDGQTFVGALSTSTHGSGLSLPPLCDAVRSLDLVGAGGRLYRIEPTRGLTDPDKFTRRHGTTMRLVQSDAWFWSCVVSLGCLGVIHSVTAAVSPAYLLTERRELRRWADVARELGTGAPLARFRNYEVLLHPYPLRSGGYACLVTERNIAPPGTERRPLDEGRRAAESVSFLGSTQRELLSVMKSEPRLIPGILQAGLEALETGQRPHVDHSYVVYNVGKINTADVMSGEYFFPLHENAFLRAIERLLALCGEHRRRGIYQPSPLALRFVAGSRAPLSMVRGEAHCAVEIACFNGLPYAAEALLDFERLCLELGGRPHWGQCNELTGAPGWLGRAYPGLDSWLSTYRELNGSGLFENHFTDRLGLSLS